jgi:uncharacterized membrane protein
MVMTGKKDLACNCISNILFAGSLCAALLLVLGLGLMLIRGNSADQIGNLAQSSFSDFLSALLKGESTAVINLGILAMMLTPFLRVSAAILSFLLEKDYRYAIIGLGVAVILLFTIIPSFKVMQEKYSG